jgi:hypothetical protein
MDVCVFIFRLFSTGTGIYDGVIVAPCHRTKVLYLLDTVLEPVMVSVRLYSIITFR